MALILCLVNTSNLAEVSDYKYEVLVGDGTKAGSKTLERGVVKGHRRSDGWQKLIEKFISEKEAD